jgi:hypothetical protein
MFLRLRGRAESSTCSGSGKRATVDPQLVAHGSLERFERPIRGDAGALVPEERLELAPARGRSSTGVACQVAGSANTGFAHTHPESPQCGQKEGRA